MKKGFSLVCATLVFSALIAAAPITYAMEDPSINDIPANDIPAGDDVPNVPVQISARESAYKKGIENLYRDPSILDPFAIHDSL